MKLTCFLKIVCLSTLEKLASLFRNHSPEANCDQWNFQAANVRLIFAGVYRKYLPRLRTWILSVHPRSRRSTHQGLWALLPLARRNPALPVSSLFPSMNDFSREKWPIAYVAIHCSLFGPVSDLYFFSYLLSKFIPLFVISLMVWNYRVVRVSQISVGLGHGNKLRVGVVVVCFDIRYLMISEYCFRYLCHNS